MTAIAGLVGVEPVSRRLVDDRVAALHAGPHAGALPAVGSAEHRQLTRWVAQVVFTERICLAEARKRGLATGADPRDQDAAIELLDQRAAVELGSITAAAYGGSAVVRAVFAAVTADVRVEEGDVRRLFAYRAVDLGHPVRWVLRHGLFSDAEAAGATTARALPLMGAAAAQELPASLADALVGCGIGDTAGPLRDGLGWHLAYVEDVLPAAQADYVEVAPALRAELLAAARRRAFAHWLDRQRAELLTYVPGLEHPGDPRQPDNHHRH